MLENLTENKEEKMSGKGKEFVPEDYATAYRIMFMGAICSIHEPLSFDSESTIEDSLVHQEINPEAFLIKKDCFQKLSKESKEVISIIFNSPREVLELITSKQYKIISKKTIQKFLLENRGWSKRKVSRCFEELKVFSTSFC
jgi:hypothetical protein